MAEREDVRSFVAKLVDEHWTGTRKAILLSQVGPKVRNAFPDSPFLMPKGLLKFLQGWATVQIVRHPDIPEKIGLVPLGAELPSDTKDLFAPSQIPIGPVLGEQPTVQGVEAGQPLGKTEIAHRSYLPDFWRAFHIPIVGKRFVVFPSSADGRPQIVDSTSGAVPSERSYEITQTDVTASVGPMPDRVKATAKRIEAWLDRNSLAVEPFLSIATTRSRSLTKRSFETVGQESVIARAFAKLDPSELARINVPLDIVLKLLASTEE